MWKQSRLRYGFLFGLRWSLCISHCVGITVIRPDHNHHVFLLFFKIFLLFNIYILFQHRWCGALFCSVLYRRIPALQFRQRPQAAAASWHRSEKRGRRRERRVVMETVCFRSETREFTEGAPELRWAQRGFRLLQVSTDVRLELRSGPGRVFNFRWIKAALASSCEVTWPITVYAVRSV